MRRTIRCSWEAPKTLMKQFKVVKLLDKYRVRRKVRHHRQIRIRLKMVKTKLRRNVRDSLIKMRSSTHVRMVIMEKTVWGAR